MAGVVYLLCAVTSALCAFLLLRSFARRRLRLLLWSGICFVGLALNNALLVVDRLVIEDRDLSTVRLLPAAVGIAALVYGLVWEAE